MTEARLLASLDHPHIVPVYDFVEREGLCLLVMEQLPGGTVWTRFSTDGLTPPAAAAAVLATLAGLQAAHEHQILHRDVKPENLMFSSTGALKVTDFGIAKVVSGEDTLATRAGEVVGTPAYIAPEQARGGDLSPATDVYAVSTMFYELLSGQLPFDDDGDAMALLFKHAFETPTPLRDKAPFVPEALAEVVMRGLATDPADRYASAEEYGLAIAEACTTAWGPGWLTAEGSPVMGACGHRVRHRAGHLRTAPSHRGRRRTRHGAPRHAPAPPTVAGAPNAPAPPTVAGDPAPAAPAPPTVAAPTTAVRPTVSAHSAGVQLQDVQEADLVPVQTVLIPPAKSTVPLLLAVVGLVLVVLVRPRRRRVGQHRRQHHAGHGDGRRRRPHVGARDPLLDLSKPVVVAVSGRRRRPTGCALTLQSVGQQLTRAPRPRCVTATPSGRIAAVDLSSARYLTGGRLVGEVELLRAGTVVGHEQFGVTTKQFGLLTAAGAATILLLLFALAYAESFLRSLRKGRRTTSAIVGMAIMGVLVGVAVVSLVWVLGVRSPTIATVVVCAVLGAATGVAAAIAARRTGKRARFAELERRRAA